MWKARSLEIASDDVEAHHDQATLGKRHGFLEGEAEVNGGLERVTAWSSPADVGRAPLIMPFHELPKHSRGADTVRGAQDGDGAEVVARAGPVPRLGDEDDARLEEPRMQLSSAEENSFPELGGDFPYPEGEDAQLAGSAPIRPNGGGGIHALGLMRQLGRCRHSEGPRARVWPRPSRACTH